MQVVVRVDASLEIGSGHVMRCLTLADELRRKKAMIRFVCRDFQGHLCRTIESRGYETVLLPRADGSRYGESAPNHAAWLGTDWRTDAEETVAVIGDVPADWLIVDHYAIDSRWHAHLRASASRILVIDDLADRELDCDLLLDQTFGRSRGDYDPLVPEGCQILAGSVFALLRPEFTVAREQALRRRREFRGVFQILVSMGGVDPANVTGTVLDVLAAMVWNNGHPRVDVVLGSSAPHLADIRARVASHPLRVVLSVDTPDMAGLMSAADLAIGAAGTTSWERCCLGLPTLIAVLAENQKTVAEELERAGVVMVWDGPAELSEALKSVDKSPQKWKSMSEAAATICDGQGSQRVVQEMMPNVLD
jgi:UDP-2,4-diacetamido-2,4,6-trideoxy-beta-L-altropyranose hydrolase